MVATTTLSSTARQWGTLRRRALGAAGARGAPFGSSYAVVRDATERVVGAAHILRAQFAGLPLPYAVIERGPVVADSAMFGPVMSRLRARRAGAGSRGSRSCPTGI